MRSEVLAQDKVAVKVQEQYLENVLDDFDESYELEGMFQSMVEHYKDVFDDLVELKPMIGPK